jgi:tetratricopeptide (TPR) repeat protein
VYVRATPPRTAEAEALFAGKPGDGAEPDDLRVLALIHEVQGPPKGRMLAIADLETLIRLEAAGPEDRFALARLLEAAGEWPRAREQFRELMLRTDGRRDAETLNRRPLFIATMVEALVRHHQPGDDADLAEARQLVDKLRSIQVNPLALVLLDAQIDKAANQLAAAGARIREYAGRPGLDAKARVSLANQAERLGLTGEAEAIYRAMAARPPSVSGQIQLVDFLARQRRLKEAIDLCETLWADPALRDGVAAECVKILGDPNAPLDKEQAGRVVSWLERERAEKKQFNKPESILYLLGLGNLNERLGEYDKAMALYRTAIGLNDPDGIAANNLAWLLALKGGRGGEALDLINKAIGLKGPVPEFLDTRGMVYLLTTGDGRRAIPDLETAVNRSPNGPKLFHLAQAYLKTNEREKARKVLEAGKSRGLPGGLHPLEVGAYNQLASTLGSP